RLWDAGGKLIGSAELIENKEVTTYTHFSLPIVYTDLKAKPASMTIVATSSHYGGEFEGSKVIGQVGAGSTLWVDEFELSYYK
ncbi:MAG: PCMD domain-containing protein, partial [Odoribacter sp.]